MEVDHLIYPYIFTYCPEWQSHLEKELGLKPVRVNSFGGKDYELPKSFIRLPRRPKRLSPEEKARLQARGPELTAIRVRKQQGESASVLSGPPKEEGEKCVV